MLFNSLTFLIFFAVVLLLHHMPLRWRTKKFNLLCASYVFYAAWNPPFVILLWISTLADWFIARWIARAERPSGRRMLLVASLGVNLGLLGFFKYGGFMVDNFVRAAALTGFHIRLLRPDIVLPVGISFYTFQTLSYTFDVYRRKMAPWHSFLDYAMYVTFFPQLVAGPIVRAVDFLPQMVEPRRATARQFSWGLTMLVLGLFEKAVVADGLLAAHVEKVYDVAARPGAADAWFGTFAFAGQIFCDFAGYSSCAIGVALCLGFRLPANFHFPYAAAGFADFWRRWHISLSTWLRDYLYIALGGNRSGIGRTYLNIMATMLLGGLWHGASWTFVIWGGLHGIYLLAERTIKKFVPRRRIWQTFPMVLSLGFLTYLLVCVTWVFFRAKSFGRAFTLIESMFIGAAEGTAGILHRYDMAVIAVVTVAMLGIHWMLRDTTVAAAARRLPWWVRALILAAMLLGIATVHGEDRAFIYFQF